MGSLRLVWALIFDRGYDSNPISQNELGHSQRNPVTGRRAQILYSLIVVLLMLIGFITISRSPALLRDLPVFANVIVNMLWAVPVSAVVAHAVQRERRQLTLHLLLLTPFTTKAILLAKAAGSFARVSKVILTGLIMLSWFGAVANMFVIPLSSYSNQDTFLWVLFGAFLIGLLVIERLQELAFSVSIGLFLGATSSSSDVVIIMNFILNLAVRMTQLLVIVGLAGSGSITRELSTLAWLNLGMGTPAVLIYAPTWTNFGLVVLVIGLRELIIRALLYASIRRVPQIAR